VVYIYPIYSPSNQNNLLIILLIILLNYTLNFIINKVSLATLRARAVALA